MITIAMIDNIAKRIIAETTPVWRYDLNRITRKLREPDVLFGCGLRPTPLGSTEDRGAGRGIADDHHGMMIAPGHSKRVAGCITSHIGICAEPHGQLGFRARW